MRLQLFILLYCSLVYSCQTAGPDKRAIELNERAVKLFQERKTDSALILLDKAIQIDSNHFYAYGNKCGYLWQLNRNEEALETARQFKNPSGGTYSWLGLAYEHAGYFDS